MTEKLQWNEIAFALRCCGSAFQLRPDPDGVRYVLWWTEEDRWVVRFPSRRAAEDFIVGRQNDWPLSAGVDRSDVPLDLGAALRQHEQKTGEHLQLELDEASVFVDLYARLDLAIEFASRLAFYEIDSGDNLIDADQVEMWRPFVVRCLGARGHGLSQEHATLLTEVLLRVVKGQHDLVEGIERRCRPSNDLVVKIEPAA